MDNKTNYILFLILSLAIIFGYTYFFSKPPENTNQQQSAQGPGTAPGQSPPGTQGAPTEDFQDASYIEAEIQVTQQGELFSVDTPLYRGTIDTYGARILSWELKDYKLSTNGNGELVNLFMDSPPGFSTLLKLNGLNIPDLIPFRVEGDMSVSITQGTEEITFYWDSPEGVRIKKIYELDAETYLVKQRFEVENTGSGALQERLDILWYGNIKSLGRGENSRTCITMVAQFLTEVWPAGIVSWG